MNSEFTSNWNIQLKKGLLLVLVMNIIKKKSCYGYQIIKEIKESTGIELAEGTLYSLLKNLKNRKLVLSKWSINEGSSPRKYYYLTGSGNMALKEMNNHWLSLNQSVAKLINS